MSEPKTLRCTGDLVMERCEPLDVLITQVLTSLQRDVGVLLAQARPRRRRGGSRGAGLARLRP
eukprot:scaffold17952_cov39-Phaeocystis_antarctica.AAC.1